MATTPTDSEFFSLYGYKYTRTEIIKLIAVSTYPLDLRGVDLEGVDLSGLDLSKANLTGSNLTGAKLAYSD